MGSSALQPPHSSGSSFPAHDPARRSDELHVGSISYLNTRPLIYGLVEEDADRLTEAGWEAACAHSAQPSSFRTGTSAPAARPLKLSFDVPARLLDGLRRNAYDVALLPVIDYQRMEGLRVIPAAGIGCDGPTLTVRLFSQQPIEQTRVLACDPDSHTSVALARIVLAELFGARPEFVPLHHAQGAPGEARLLIGDKVVCEEPPGFDYQLDLGAAWKRLTGLPFVFATWVARDGVELGELPARLESAKRDGLAHVGEIIRRFAIPRGWPAGVALQYLTVYLKYDIGPRQLEAIELFHRKSADHGIIPSPPAPLVVV